jgi:rhamnogalacturonan endolyase
MMEKLGRGVIAVRSTEKQVYVGWRLLGTDPQGVAFNLYRSTGPLTKTTFLTHRTATVRERSLGF